MFVVKINMKCFSMSPKHHTASYLWPDRVLYPNNTDGGEVIQDAVLIFPVRLGVTGEVTVRHTDGPEAVTRHGLNHLLHHLVLVPWTEDPHLPYLAQDMAASVIKVGVNS